MTRVTFAPDHDLWPWPMLLTIQLLCLITRQLVKRLRRFLGPFAADTVFKLVINWNWNDYKVASWWTFWAPNYFTRLDMCSPPCVCVVVAVLAASLTVVPCISICFQARCDDCNNLCRFVCCLSELSLVAGVVCSLTLHCPSHIELCTFECCNSCVVSFVCVVRCRNNKLQLALLYRIKNVQKVLKAEFGLESICNFIIWFFSAMILVFSWRKSVFKICIYIYVL